MERHEILKISEALKECASAAREPGAAILEVSVRGPNGRCLVIPLADPNIRKTVADRLTVMGCELEFEVWNL